MRPIKKFLLIFIILSLITAAAVVYLNRVFLPQKIKSLIISGLQDATGKEVSLNEVKFNIFKGLVLRGLVISEGKKTFFSASEISCAVFIPAILQKNIVLSSLRIKSALLLLERREDSSFNIQDLFKHPAGKVPGKKPQFSLVVSHVAVSSSSIHFEDKTFSVPFKKNIDNINLVLNFFLPSSVKFKLKCQLSGNPVAGIEAAGQYGIINNELTGQASIKDFLVSEYQLYLNDFGIKVNSGTATVEADFKFKENIFSAKLVVQSRDIAAVKEEIEAKVNSDISAEISYGLLDKKLAYAGTAIFERSDILSANLGGPITGIEGTIKFNDQSLSSDKLRATVFGVPVEAKINLSDFKDPLLTGEITCGLDLNSTQQLLKEKFKIELPAVVRGQGKLRAKVKAKLPVSLASARLDGWLDISRGELKLDKIEPALEEISGTMEFNLNEIKWPQINFKYAGRDFETSGELSDFRAPYVQCKLKSKDLSLESNFKFKNSSFEISKLQGGYLGCGFSLKGKIDIADSNRLSSDLNGKLKLDLEDVIKFKPELAEAKPKGIVDIDFQMQGNLKDAKSCAIQADLQSPSLSFYGLKLTDFSAGYNQADATADIRAIKFSLYDGQISADAKVNLDAKDFPFWLNFAVEGIKIEKLKIDTVAKDKDIAGIIDAGAKMKGFIADINRINAAGNVNISEGKLWELNLFKGLGSLLFVKDFDRIVFSQASCDFLVQDKYIVTDNLKLKSNITDLDGKVKIGFDSSLEAALNVRVLDENVPLSGTFKDVTQAIIGTAGRFGAIKISGTLKEPKYKFQPAVVDLIKGVKDILFGRE